MRSPASPTTEQSADIQQGVARWNRKQVSGMVMLAGILFLSAGRLDWLHGWLYVGIYALTIVMQAVILIPRSPGLLAERSKLQRGTKRWDVILSSVGLLLATILTLVVAGLDERYGWSGPLPRWAIVAAVGVMAAGWALIIWAMANNPFFSATVRVQTDRGQQVMTGGPYRYIRHPGYAGAILYNAVTPIILNSLWALIPTAVVVIFFVLRTVGEDPVLQRELPGYRDYARQVPDRLIPGIW